MSTGGSTHRQWIFPCQPPSPSFFAFSCGCDIQLEEWLVCTLHHVCTSCSCLGGASGFWPCLVENEYHFVSFCDIKLNSNWYILRNTVATQLQYGFLKFYWIRESKQPVICWWLTRLRFGPAYQVRALEFQCYEMHQRWSQTNNIPAHLHENVLAWSCCCCGRARRPVSQCTKEKEVKNHSKLINGIT